MVKSLIRIVPATALAILMTASCSNQKQDESTGKVEVALAGFNLNNLDTTAQPCDDFFQYVAGGWIANNPIPETESRWGNFNILREENRSKMKGLLDSVSRIESFPAESRYADLLSKHYAAGLDTAQISTLGLEPLEPYLTRIANIDNREKYQAYLSYALQQGFTAPLRSRVSVDDKNSDAYILSLGQSGLGLPDRDYYLKTDSASVAIQENYEEHIKIMLMLAGFEDARASTAAEKIYDLEKRMAKVMMSRVDRRDPANTYNKYSYSQIIKMAPAFPLKRYFEESEIKFDSALVSQPEYLKAANYIFKQEPLENLRFYHTWHLLSSASAYLPSTFEKETFRFYATVLQGTKKMKPRWERVVERLGGGLGEQMGRLFVERYFSEESKAAVEQMVEDLRSAYAGRIKQLKWMSDSTKQRALQKLEAFKYKIGYPDKWEDLEGLELTDDQYFENHLRISRFNREDNLSKLGTEVDRDEWFMPANMVNAYYNPSYNEIVFPAGILQPPFYDVEADAAINYGGIGGVIGHEFSHGFDDQGSKYDAKGNLKDWWTTEDRTNFDSRTALMAQQYSAYEPLHDVSVNGELTLGENIADLGGLTMAYYGYQHRLNRMNKEPQVKAGFTWQQRIFLGWGQVWQTAQTDEFTKNQVMTDPHSPAQYRVNGPVSNMPEFWEAFNCQSDDAMVRSDSLTVEIW